MKVTHITDIDKFFEVIDSCKGRVELVTGEGDRLNLKSKLSQYVSLANIFSAGEIPELEIVAAEKEDIDKLMNFMIMMTEKNSCFFLCYHYIQFVKQTFVFCFASRLRQGCEKLTSLKIVPLISR